MQIRSKVQISTLGINLLIAVVLSRVWCLIIFFFLYLNIFKLKFRFLTDSYLNMSCNLFKLKKKIKKMLLFILY